MRIERVKTYKACRADPGKTSAQKEVDQIAHVLLSLLLPSQPPLSSEYAAGNVLNALQASLHFNPDNFQVGTITICIFQMRRLDWLTSHMHILTNTYIHPTS